MTDAMEIVDLCETDEEDDRKPAAVPDYDDVEVLDAPKTPAANAMDTEEDGSNEENELTVVGTVNQVRLPHMRQHCTEFPFATDAMKYCDCCYCYVCDVPVKECKNWTFHSKATDEGPNANYYKRQRLDSRNGKNPESSTGASINNTQNNAGAGFAASITPQVHGKMQTSKECRYCGSPENSFVTSFCKTCARVWISGDQLKTYHLLRQGKTYTRQKGDMLLGTKKISFRLRSHDPRKISSAKKSWEANEGKPGWVYDEQQLAADMFDSRLGEQPTLEALLMSIPVLSLENLPTDGSDPKRWGYSRLRTKKYAIEECQALILEEPSDRELLFQLYRVASSFGVDSGYHHQHIFLDGDINASFARQTGKGTITVRVFLQPSSRSNTKIQVLQRSGFLGVWFGILPFSLKELNLNFRAEASVESVRAKAEEGRIDPLYGEHLLDSGILKDYTLTSETRRAIEREAAKAAEKYNVEIADSDMNTLDSSSKTDSPAHKLLGGICLNHSELRGTLLRLFREAVPEILAIRYPTHVTSLRTSGHWLSKVAGGLLPNPHRGMRWNQTQHSLLSPVNRFVERSPIRPFLSDEDEAILRLMREDACRLYDAHSSHNGLMMHLESRGHEVAEFVEGLKIELLPFQRQALQWASERELSPGGVQSFLWTKLPNVEECPGQDVYYNPLLETFSRNKPKLVRGGILAQNMGMGKTVICLALILKNPAPLLPVSGSPSSEIPEEVDFETAFWDPDLGPEEDLDAKAMTDEDVKPNLKVAPVDPPVNPKRGSILSRGTLVVCKVSLVGQWVEEAMAKLEDPGLVYSYHGQSRRRDPALLAKNSIVVTTYETLQSDEGFHKAKSGDSSYCAPCEQVRWWRIICDESHTLRSVNKKSKAVAALVAENKWLVTGTPINTTINDFKNQLEFLGIQKTTQLMSLFRHSFYFHVNDPSKKQGRSRRGVFNQEVEKHPGVGFFCFMMRSLMMRHSQQQVYSGTSTALMSLPPKTELTLTVSLDQVERKQYDTLESAAQKFYLTCARQDNIGRHYLMFFQKLSPLRIACAGGPVPEEDETNAKKGSTEDPDSVESKTPEDGTDEEMDETDELSESSDKASSEDTGENGEVEGSAKPKARPKRFSEFAFTSKLKLLIAELKKTREGDATAKTLIFSQFGSTLDWLKVELPKHGFQYRTLSGDMSMKKRARALHEFQNDPPTTVFLLSTRAGSVGINLTQANLVVLMEPCFNPAVEAQAIGRVHRLGQKRAVKILRLVVEDSVETRIVDHLAKKYSSSETSNDNVTAPEPENLVCVGSIQREKAVLVREELDFLFGVPQTQPEPEEASGDEDIGTRASL